MQSDLLRAHVFFTMGSATSDVNRVVLLVKSEASDDDIVKAFLRYSNDSEHEYEQNRHYIHLDPDRSGSSRWSHIILDMNASDQPAPTPQDIPHEIYRTQARQNELYDHESLHTGRRCD